MILLSKIETPAKLEFLGDLLESVRSAALNQGFTGGKLNNIELAAEEAIVNICNHAYPEQAGAVEVRCKSEDGVFLLEIVDSGIPFDVSSLPDPDIQAGLEERKIGGLGIFFMKKMMDDVRYFREGSLNILCLSIKK